MAIIIQQVDRPATAHEAVERLIAAGISEEAIGFLSHEGIRGHFHLPPELNPDDMSGREGVALGTLAGLLTAVAALATPLGPVIAAGPLLGSLIGALAGGATGGIVATLVEGGVDEDVAHVLEATLESDEAMLISVEVPRGREAEIRRLLADVAAHVGPPLVVDSAG